MEKRYAGSGEGVKRTSEAVYNFAVDEEFFEYIISIDKILGRYF